MLLDGSHGRSRWALPSHIRYGLRFFSVLLKRFNGGQIKIDLRNPSIHRRCAIKPRSAGDFKRWASQHESSLSLCVWT